MHSSKVEPEEGVSLLTRSHVPQTGVSWVSQQTLVNVFTVVFIIFLFLLPLESWIFNDLLGFVDDFCNVPADEIKCGVDVNYAAWAERLNRRNKHGQLIGCGCEQGILGDWVCPLDSTYFSISAFIATAPGTGAMAALSAWPIIGMFSYGARTMKGPAENLVTNSLYAFVFFYGLFLINTTCVTPTLHIVVVLAFIVALVVHYAAILYNIGWKCAGGKIIWIALAIGISAVVIGPGISVFFPGNSWIQSHAFWLGESIGISAGFLVAPLLNLLPQVWFVVLPTTARVGSIP